MLACVWVNHFSVSWCMMDLRFVEKLVEVMDSLIILDFLLWLTNTHVTWLMRERTQSFIFKFRDIWWRATKHSWSRNSHLAIASNTFSLSNSSWIKSAKSKKLTNGDLKIYALLLLSQFVIYCQKLLLNLSASRMDFLKKIFSTKL